VKKLTHHKLVPSWAGAGVGLLALAAIGCGPEAGKPKGPPEGPFAVSDYFAASGAMGDGSTPPRLTINEGKECKARPTGARGNCFAFFYDPSIPTSMEPAVPSVLWSGLYWQYPPNNWGEEPGLKLPAGLTKVSFQAAVADGKNEMVQFAAGGIGIPADATLTDYPNDDVFRAPLGVNLNGEWAKLEIMLPQDPNQPINELIGAFTWSLNYPMDTDPTLVEPKTLYIDDLFYE